MKLSTQLTIISSCWQDVVITLLEDWELVKEIDKSQKDDSISSLRVSSISEIDYSQIQKWNVIYVLFKPEVITDSLLKEFKEKVSSDHKVVKILLVDHLTLNQNFSLVLSETVPFLQISNLSFESLL